MKGAIQSFAWRAVQVLSSLSMLASLLQPVSSYGQNTKVSAPSEPSPKAINSSNRIIEEPDIKAELVFRFRTLFIWPNPASNSPENPWKIGVLGSNPYGEAFDRKIRARRKQKIYCEVVSGSRPEQLKGCQVVFIPRAESHDWAAIHREWDNKSVLLVGEQADFIEHGGAVSILIKEESPYLKISRHAVETAHLQFTGNLYHDRQIEIQ